MAIRGTATLPGSNGRIGALARILLPVGSKQLLGWVLANTLAGAAFGSISSMLAPGVIIGFYIAIGIPLVPLLIFGLWMLIGAFQWLGVYGALPTESAHGGSWILKVGLAGVGATFAALPLIAIVGLEDQNAYDPVINSRGQGLSGIICLALIGAITGLLVGWSQRSALDPYSRTSGWLRSSVLSWSGGLALAGIFFGEGGLRTLQLLCGYGSPFYALLNQGTPGQAISSAIADGFILGAISLPMGLRLPAVAQRRAGIPFDKLKLLVLVLLAAAMVSGFSYAVVALPPGQREFQFGMGNVSTAAWSPDSRLVAASGRNEQVQVWDAASGATVATLNPGSYDTNNSGHNAIMSWSPDGRWLALVAVSKGDMLQLWSTQSWEEAARIAGGEQITGVAWAPDSQHVAVSVISYEGVMQREAAQIWDVFALARASPTKTPTTATQEPDASLTILNSINSMVWSADGRRLVFAGQQSQVCDVTGAAGCVDFGPADTLFGASWSPDGERLLYYSETEVGVWDLAQGRNSEKASLFRVYIGSLRWSADGQPLIAYSWGGSVLVTSPATKADPQQYTFADNAIDVVAWSPDGECLLAGSVYGRIMIWPTRK